MIVKSKHLAALVTAAAVTALAGCGSARKGDLSEQRFKDDSQLARGRVMFMQHCNQCHVQGGPGLGPGIIDKPLPSAAIKMQVRTAVVGAGTMPKFGPEKIPDPDLDAIVHYIKVLQSEGTPLAMR